MISKKILASIMVVGLLALSVGWGTYSYFSDTETATNTFTAGTLDLTVDGKNGEVVTFGWSNLKPGDQPKHKYTLSNIGSINGYLNLNTSFVSTEDTRTEPEIEAGDTTDGEGELDDVLNVRMFLDYNGDGWISAGEPVFYNGKVKDLPLSIKLNEVISAGGGVEFVTEIYDWWNTPMDNQAQSDSVVVTIIFNLTQQLWP